MERDRKVHLLNHAKENLSHIGVIENERKKIIFLLNDLGVNKDDLNEMVGHESFFGMFGNSFSQLKFTSQRIEKHANTRKIKIDDFEDAFIKANDSVFKSKANIQVTTNERVAGSIKRTFQQLEEQINKLDSNTEKGFLVGAIKKSLEKIRTEYNDLREGIKEFNRNERQQQNESGLKVQRGNSYRVAS